MNKISLNYYENILHERNILHNYLGCDNQDRITFQLYFQDTRDRIEINEDSIFNNYLIIFRNLMRFHIIHCLSRQSQFHES